MQTPPKQASVDWHSVLSMQRPESSPFVQRFPWSTLTPQKHPLGQTGQHTFPRSTDPQLALQQSPSTLHGALVAPLQTPPQQVWPAGQSLAARQRQTRPPVATFAQ
jgi:hypothetical protein